MNMGSGESNSQDFELNLASIIDCFTVLITFMLASASFLSLGIMDAGVAAAGATQNAGTPPPINITVELKPGHQMVVAVTGKLTSNTPIQARGTDWNYDDLTQNLGALKAKFNDVNAVTLTADNATEYRDVVKTMEVLRKSMPAVLLG